MTARLQAVEHRVHEINEKFCSPAFFESASRTEVQRLEAEQKRLDEEVATLMARWEALEGELGTLAAAAS